MRKKSSKYCQHQKNACASYAIEEIEKGVVSPKRRSTERGWGERADTPTRLLPDTKKKGGRPGKGGLTSGWWGEVLLTGEKAFLLRPIPKKKGIPCEGKKYRAIAGGHGYRKKAWRKKGGSVIVLKEAVTCVTGSKKSTKAGHKKEGNSLVRSKDTPLGEKLSNSESGFS